jgi:hypothetical protein
LAFWHRAPGGCRCVRCSADASERPLSSYLPRPAKFNKRLILNDCRVAVNRSGRGSIPLKSGISRRTIRLGRGRMFGQSLDCPFSERLLGTSHPT